MSDCIKNEIEINKIYNHWHLCLDDTYDINRLWEVVEISLGTIKDAKGNKFNQLIDGLSTGSIERNELRLFLEKLEYYLNEINIYKTELRNHIVSTSFNINDIHRFRQDFDYIYNAIESNKIIDRINICINRRYKKILKGISCDFSVITDKKKAKYVKSYIELIFIVAKVNEFWNNELDRFCLERFVFKPATIQYELEILCLQIKGIIEIYDVNWVIINRGLRKNLSIEPLNPYKEETYMRYKELLRYLYLYKLN